MTKNIICLIIFTALFICCASEKKCSDFKTGNFKYLNPNLADWKITRNDTLQIETNTANGLKVSGTIKWKSDCEYEMVYVKTNYPKLQKMIGQKVNVKIISIKNDTITYQATSDTIKKESKMIKITRWV